MKPPKCIQIGPLKYRIKVRKHIYNQEGQQLSGTQYAYSQQIVLDKDSSPAYQAATALHECIHAIFENAGFKEDHDEKLINCFSYGFLDLVRQNPDFIQWLQEQAHE